MSNLSQNQIQIVSDLLIDNGLIINEAKSNPLIWDHNFSLHIVNIMDKCYKLYIAVLNNEVTQELALNRISSILNKLAEYRNEYAEFTNHPQTVGYVMYKYMNSLFDKTLESFTDFLNNLD